tara:strand:- start:2790 stop:3494 length:705 start_codon:yes stop_codon:yes gene_type:complete
MSFLGSLLFNIILYSSLPMACLVILVLYPFVSSVNLSKITALWITFILTLLKYLCGVNWRVTGIENIPDTPVILISNHQGQWESLYLQTIVYPLSSIIKQEILLIPFFGWALGFLSPIPINRKNKLQSLRKVLDIANKRLNNGFSVLVFPEGTRVRPEDGISSFSNSCGLLSVKNNIPILPVCHNSGKYWRSKEFVKQPGTIRVSIGPMFSGNDPKTLTNDVRAWMEQEYKKIT